MLMNIDHENFAGDGIFPLPVFCSFSVWFFWIWKFIIDGFMNKLKISFFLIWLIFCPNSWLHLSWLMNDFLKIKFKFKINPIGPGRCYFDSVIFKLMLWIENMIISCKIVLMWMQPIPVDDKSVLVQLISWCHQAPSHCPMQCWPRSVSPYGITRPQWVNPVYTCHCAMCCDDWNGTDPNTK